MPLPDIQAAGYILFCRQPTLGFLLMKHPQRWDLPKGRLDPGETIEQAARREVLEETGFPDREIQTDPLFRYVSRYEIPGGKKSGMKIKELTIFLGWTEFAKTPILTEHEGFAWWNWDPPHRIQENTIDPLLHFVHEHFLSFAAK